MEGEEQGIMEESKEILKGIKDTSLAAADKVKIDEDVQQKTVRRRKKQLLSQITQQMEFYFSPANVTKDRFMSELLSVDDYIPLSTFFKFNRIRSLTTDLELLRTAISKSSILELSEDREKVRSKTKIEPKEDETECTVYVENIPMQADHEWVRQVFAQYGTIDYISLPRFRHSGRPKGFVFVEFRTPAMASSALEAFGALDCRIPSTLDPADLQSIKSFTGDTAEEECMKKGPTEGMEEGEAMGSESMEETNENVETVHKQNQEVEEKLGKNGKKRKYDSDSESDRGKVKKLVRNSSSCEGEDVVESRTVAAEGGKVGDQEVKESCNKHIDELNSNKQTGGLKSKSEAKADLEKNDLCNTSEGKREKKRKCDETKTQGSEKKKKRKESKNEKKETADESAAKEEQMQDDMGENEVTSSGSAVNGKKKKKKRKRNKKEKEEEVDSIYLRVMSKADWKKLRNKYLNAQWENMKALKRELQERYQVVPEGTGEWHHGSLLPDTSLISGAQMSLSTKKESSENPSTKPQFAPNTIVKISFEEPPQDPKKLREAIRNSGGDVAYVDVNATEQDVFVRFQSAEAATAYQKTGCWSRMEILSGKEEEEYWQRITECWSQRRARKSVKCKFVQPGCPFGGGEARGREKLLVKAVRDAQSTKPNTHIVFDD